MLEICRFAVLAKAADSNPAHYVGDDATLSIMQLYNVALHAVTGLDRIGSCDLILRDVRYFDTSWLWQDAKGSVTSWRWNILRRVSRIGG